MTHREAVESLYQGVCSVYEYHKVMDKKTKLTKGKIVTVAESIPCRLSFSGITATTSDGKTVKRHQAAKLFLAPEVAVKAGSKIVVTQNGIKEEYKGSGDPAIYESHQEIMLELFERFA